MSAKGNKFGAFKGVFTPSILTILGVIMYLRLPWIIGQAGLWATLGIILVAHIISVTTGLSVASIATDKKVETGGTYYMISRSLGLPIGGTLGLALFVGLSFSISLYIIGFSETLLTAFGLEVTLNTIRLTGAITLLVVTIVSFISTNLALKTQFLILGIMVLSIASILLGQHEFVPKTPLSGSAVNSLPWIALFAIFFPAVQGFEAGVSMSGDLANPKKAIPIGTISAILVGFVVYIGLVFFFSYTVERDALLNDSSVLLNISLYSPLVIAGIWGATLSSAFGGLLGAPRILQATAMDRITPKVFAKGVGAGNEPRNALLLTFVIALAGIMIGDLNVIARVVSTFFIITYGFLNLTCALENWAGTDFRPSFRIPAWISVIGSIACFVIMIQLDLPAMIGATIILGAIYLLLKRKELRLQSGDTWGGFWSSLVKYGLFKLSASEQRNQRNWRPNIILFSGGAAARPHLIDMGRTLVGKQGVFTNFELIERKSDDTLFEKTAKPSIEVDRNGKKVITRRHVCKNIYEGIEMIARVYGFTGFEPNTILLGLPKQEKKISDFLSAVKTINNLDYNIVIHNKVTNPNLQKIKSIDLWWHGNSRNLNFGLSLLKYISTDGYWRGANIRLLVINYNTAKTDSIYSLLNQAIDNERLIASVKVINNATEKLSELDIIKSESVNSNLAILELSTSTFADRAHWAGYINQIAGLPFTTLTIEASNGFELINAGTQPKKEEQTKELLSTTPLIEKIKLPEKEILAEIVRTAASKHEVLTINLNKNSAQYAQKQLIEYTDELKGITNKLFSSLKRIKTEDEKISKSTLISKAISEFTFQAKTKVLNFRDETLTDIAKALNVSQKVYIEYVDKHILSLPDKLNVNFNRSEFKTRKNDPLGIRLFKAHYRTKGALLGWPISIRLDIRDAAELFLKQTRIEAINEYFEQIGLSTFRYISNTRKNLVELTKIIESESIEGLNLNEIKDNTNQTFIDSIEEFETINNRISNNLNVDLERNFQRFSFALSKPEAKHLVSPYKKIIAKNNLSITDIENQPQTFSSNITLYVNKNLLEFILISLNHRFKIKLKKQADELSYWANSKLSDANKNLSQIFTKLATANELPDTSEITLKLSELKKTEVQERFETLFKDINGLVDELPQKMEVNDDSFFAQVDAGLFPQSVIRTIELRQKAQLYIGTELISNARNAMEELSDSFKEIATKLSDKLRLTLFNIENSLANEEDRKNTNQNEIRAELVNGLKKEIETEQLHVKRLLEKFENELNVFLKHSLDPLHQMVYSKQPDAMRHKKRAKAKKQTQWFAKRVLKNTSNFFNRQFVKALYSQSEGIMLAHKLTSFETEYKVSNQSIQEMIVKLSPNESVARSIPFYYVSLFSGSTSLSNELWIERPQEQAEAQRIIERFKGGFAGALIITGDRNSGKTTLSKYIAKTLLPNHSLHSVRPPKGGSTFESDFSEALSISLNIETAPSQFIASSPQKRVIIINDLELWWTRHESGFEVIQKILTLIELHSKKVLFIINCRAISYQLINRLINIDNYVMGHISCEPFDAKELKELVIIRHQTGGLRFVLNNKSEESLSEWNYAKLFNRYFNLSGGNPGYTLQSWLANISKVVGKTIYISPPTIPNLSHLDGISDDLWMVILQIALHRRCTPTRLSIILRQSEKETRLLLTEMLRSGLVEERFTNVFALNPILEPFLLNKMREKGLC